MHLDQYRMHHDEFCERDEEKIGAPYSQKNPHLETLQISSQHFGDICRGIRRPGPRLAQKLVTWSDGHISIADMYEFFELAQGDTPTPTPGENTHAAEVAVG